MRKLNLYDADDVEGLVWPNSRRDTNLYSSALTVLTDFNVHQPSIMHHTMHAIDAETSMRRQHVRFQLVVDDQERFIGILDVDALNDAEILKKVAQGFKRDELLVTDFMVSKHSILCLDYTEVAGARVHDIQEALERLGRDYCLVVDRESQSVRGVVSVRDIPVYRETLAL